MKNWHLMAAAVICLSGVTTGFASSSESKPPIKFRNSDGSYKKDPSTSTMFGPIHAEGVDVPAEMIDSAMPCLKFTGKISGPLCSYHVYKGSSSSTVFFKMIDNSGVCSWNNIQRPAEYKDTKFCRKVDAQGL
ncbi:MAG: hypothetical protein ACTHJ4_07425 [Candidatus Nucleicultricaceae bacterium]|jgi:hypothetical protein